MNLQEIGRLLSAYGRINLPALVFVLLFEPWVSAALPCFWTSLPASAAEPLKAKTRIARRIQSYFVTSRLNEGSRSEPQFGALRHLDLGSGSLEYGTAALSLPAELPLPSQAANGIEYRDSLARATQVWQSARLNFAACFSEEAMLDKVRQCKGKICIYIHGYDNSFLESLQDAGMLFADQEQYLSSAKGADEFLPILFSWPSADSSSKYSVDEANLEWSRKSFNQFLDRVIKEKNPDCALHVVAHSLGSKLVTDYIAARADKLSEPVLSNLYLCSSDLDYRELEDMKASVEKVVAGKTYIFVSDKDRPLIASQILHGAPRLGRPVDPPGKKANDQAASVPAGNSVMQGFADKIASSGFWKDLALDAAEVWIGPNKTDLPEVLAWLAQNPSLDCEFSERCTLIDVSNLALSNLGHAISWSVVSSFMAGQEKIPQLQSRVVHKYPDQIYLNQCGGKPRVLYRFHRLDPF